MLNISIPAPCHEDWNAMTSNENGRHCCSCAKTVVDFTVMSDEEVKYFLLNKKEEKVCGRFRNEQLQHITIELPGNIFNIPMPLWKKILLASLVAFSTSLFSCNTNIKGETELKTGTTGVIITEPIKVSKMGAPELIADTVTIIDKNYPVTTIMSSPIIVGALMAPEIIADIANTSNKCLSNDIPVEMGEIQLITDSIQIKNPPMADSINCDKDIFTKL